MIEIEHSRTGQPYLVVNNHHLSSSVDPVREARKWVQMQEERIENAHVVYVLGLGSGYHVQELAQSWPHKEIHVFEAQKEVMTVVRGLHAFPPNVTLHEAASVAQVASELEPSLLSQTQALLRYPPSIHLFAHLYRELIFFLTGRHPGYIATYQRLIPSYENLTNLDQVITIHDFAKAAEDKGDVLTREDRIWLLLRELVK